MMEPFFADFFTSMRKYWNDTIDNNNYYLAVLPMRYADTVVKQTWGSISGYIQGNGFIMNYGPSFSKGAIYTLSHESSHHWIGSRINVGNDMEHQWFVEGFTEYTCLVNMTLSKLFSTENFLNAMNKENFKGHYSSPVKNIPNTDIAEKFWTDYQYEKLPYRRGLIYAFYLDNQIRIASKGAFTLRNFMLELFEKAKNQDDPLSIDDFIQAAGKYLPKEQVATELDKYIIQGIPIVWKQEYLIPEFQLSFKDSIPQISMADKANIMKVYSFE